MITKQDVRPILNPNPEQAIVQGLTTNADERILRIQMYQSRLRQHLEAFWTQMYRPQSGPEALRVTEVLRGEDALISETMFFAKVFNQEWSLQSIDDKLAARVSWNRKGREEGVSVLLPPFSTPLPQTKRTWFQRIFSRRRQ